MMNEKQITEFSKFLSLILRHQPETIGIQLDANGWADVDELIIKSNQNGIGLNRNILEHIVSTNSKKRFAFNDDHTRIRANQGHSISVELGYANQQPPEFLYHGTGEKSVPFIWESGIEKRSRQHVHLSSDTDTAVKVGQRHGKPFVFVVFARKMFDDNYVFYLSENGVWLTDHVPVKYIEKFEW